MIKKNLKLCLLGLTIFSTSAFCEELQFTAAQLSGNFTRVDLKHFKNFKYHNPTKCSFDITIVGTDGSEDINADEVNIDPVDGHIETKYALQALEQAVFFMEIGDFVELKNSEKHTIPECAHNIEITFSN